MNKLQRGFTLLELSIVVLSVGAVIGGIFAVIALVHFAVKYW